MLLMLGLGPPLVVSSPCGLPFVIPISDILFLFSVNNHNCAVPYCACFAFCVSFGVMCWEYPPT